MDEFSNGNNWITNLPITYQSMQFVHWTDKYAALHCIPYPKGVITGDHVYYPVPSILECVFGLNYDAYFPPI
eukprot:10193595-Ditylum_brightwellii.AAC.1